MSVVNVRVSHLRPKYHDLKEWMKCPDNEYVGRGRVVFIEGCRFPPEDSVWKNPFKISGTMTREKVVAQYEVYIRERLAREPELRTQLESLRGKTLGCWCYPASCHANVLLKILAQNQYHPIAE